jgi:hypothetical protein
VGSAIEERLLRNQTAVEAARERLRVASGRLDATIVEATQPPYDLSKSHIGRVLGLRRETIYNAVLRAEARKGDA